MVAVLLAPGAPTLSQCYIIVLNLVPPQGSAKGRWSSLEEATYTSLEQPAQDSKAPTAPRLGAMTRAILTLTSDEDEPADQGPEVEAAIKL